MRKCGICGAEFQEKNATHLYCSAKCNCEANRRSSAACRLAKAGKQRTDSFTIVCKNCGKTFTGTSQRLVYCSPGCRIEAAQKRSKTYWEKRKEGLMMEHTCAMCGKTFKTTAVTAKFCPDCRPERRAKEKEKNEAKLKGEERMDAKIREAMEKHISYGMLQVIAAREAAKAAREKEKA